MKPVPPTILLIDDNPVVCERLEAEAAWVSARDRTAIPYRVHCEWVRASTKSAAISIASQAGSFPLVMIDLLHDENLKSPLYADREKDAVRASLSGLLCLSAALESAKARNAPAGPMSGGVDRSACVVCVFSAFSSLGVVRELIQEESHELNVPELREILRDGLAGKGALFRAPKTEDFIECLPSIVRQICDTPLSAMSHVATNNQSAAISSILSFIQAFSGRFRPPGASHERGV